MNVLFIGLGRIAQRYLRIIKKDFQIKNIYVIRFSNSHKVIYDNLSHKIVKDIYKYYKIKKINFRDLKLIKPEIIFITNAPAKRYKLINSLLKYKAHIFCEKPIFETYDYKKFIKISNKIKENKKIFYCGFLLRIHPIFILLKEIINSNKYGKLLYIKMDICEGVHKFNKYINIKDSHYVSQKLGGGVLLAQCHEIDILYFFFKKIKLNHCSSFPKKIMKDIDVELLVHLDFEIKHNNLNIPVALNMDMLENFPKREGVFYFENRIFQYDLIENEYTITNTKNLLFKEYKLKNFNRIDLFKNEIKDFFKLIKGYKKNYCTINEGIKSLKCIHQIRKKIK